MEIKQLNLSDIHQDLLINFNRYQEVKQRYKRTGSDYLLEDVSYIRDLDADKKQWAINYFINCLTQGGISLELLMMRS